MSVRKELVWKCDLCGTEQAQPDYGLPHGWRCYLNFDESSRVVHACGGCLTVPKHWIDADRRLQRAAAR